METNFIKMRYGTLSTLGRIQTLLSTTDLNANRLSALAALYEIEGASEATLSRALKGGKGLSPQTDAELGDLVTKINGIIARVAPPAILSFREPLMVKQMLDGVEQGTFFLVAVNDEAPNGEARQ